MSNDESSISLSFTTRVVSLDIFWRFSMYLKGLSYRYPLLHILIPISKATYWISSTLYPLIISYLDQIYGAPGAKSEHFTISNIIDFFVFASFNPLFLTTFDDCLWNDAMYNIYWHFLVIRDTRWSCINWDWRCAWYVITIVILDNTLNFEVLCLSGSWYNVSLLDNLLVWFCKG